MRRREGSKGEKRENEGERGKENGDCDDIGKGKQGERKEEEKKGEPKQIKLQR